MKIYWKAEYTRFLLIGVYVCVCVCVALLHRVLFIIICAIVFFLGTREAGRQATTLCCIVLVWFGFVGGINVVNEWVSNALCTGFWGIVQQSKAFGNAHLCERVYGDTIDIWKRFTSIIPVDCNSMVIWPFSSLYQYYSKCILYISVACCVHAFSVLKFGVRSKIL